MTQTSKPKTLVITSSSMARGAEIEAVQLVANLRLNGVPAMVQSLTRGDSPTIGSLVPLGKWRHSPTTLGRLRWAARRADVVVAYGSRALPACALALTGSSTPFIYRSIGDPAAWIRSDLHRRATAAQYRRAAAVAVLWPAAGDAVQHLFGVERARVHEVPNARDPSEFTPPSLAERSAARQRLGLADTRVVVFVGSLRPEKQIQLAVRTIAQAPGWTLVVAGDGPDRRSAEDLGARIAPGRVLFLGHQRDIASVFRIADAVLITSRTEGMPGVAIEAALSGVPVVATPVGALTSMPGVTLAAPHDSALARALDRADRATGARAEARAAYSWDAVTRRWVRLLQAVAGSSAGSCLPDE
jgi:glycosyltransferase involved in cell wall biosynthesis